MNAYVSQVRKKAQILKYFKSEMWNSPTIGLHIQNPKVESMKGNILVFKIVLADETFENL